MLHYDEPSPRLPSASADKFVETSEHGLVVLSVNEQDAGRYDCKVGGNIVCSYNITVDAHRCSAPARSNDYQKVGWGAVGWCKAGKLGPCSMLLQVAFSGLWTFSIRSKSLPYISCMSAFFSS